MKLYFCWSTNGSDNHDCHKAYQALVGTAINKPDEIVAWAQANPAR